MSAISVRLPDSLHRKVKEMAARDNVSINQLITVALAEKLSALETEDYLGKRAARATKATFQKALRRIPDREPDPYDKE
jgi:predicted DNA-binding ribbon-helix-helix protein